MNPYCIYCGAKMVMDEMKCWGECPCCGETRALQEMQNDFKPELLHGVKCPVCDGEGYVESNTEESHPYGDTYATELLTEIEDCHYCGGDGCDKDDDSCIICGEAVKDGWNFHGWEVHEGCHDEEFPRGVSHGCKL